MIWCGMLRGALRRSVVVSVALGAVWLLLPSAGDAQPRARAAALSDPCSFSSVEARVFNDTNLQMVPWFVQKGLTNIVCDNLDVGSPKPGTQDHWKFGDGFFATTVKVRYRLTNGDQVEVNASTYPAYFLGAASPTLSCGWTEVVSSPRAFDCRADWGPGASSGFGTIQVQVVPFPALARYAARARPTAVRRCRRGSALIGTTSNQTGVPLELVAVSHGAADGWCRAPRRSQAPHTAGHWKLGGPRSGASAQFVYRLPNGDEVEFAAAVNPRDGAIGCAPLDRARARLFGCRAVRKGAPNGESPRIDLQVFPIRAP